LYLIVKPIGSWKNLQQILCFEYFLTVGHIRKDIQYFVLNSPQLNVILYVDLIQFLEFLIFLWILNRQYDADEILLKLLRSHWKIDSSDFAYQSNWILIFDIGGKEVEFEFRMIKKWLFIEKDLHVSVTIILF
jgi:hypothetical protein